MHNICIDEKTPEKQQLSLLGSQRGCFVVLTTRGSYHYTTFHIRGVKELFCTLELVAWREELEPHIICFQFSISKEVKLLKMLQGG